MTSKDNEIVCLMRNIHIDFIFYIKMYIWDYFVPKVSVVQNFIAGSEPMVLRLDAMVQNRVEISSSFWDTIFQHVAIYV